MTKSFRYFDDLCIKEDEMGGSCVRRVKQETLYCAVVSLKSRHTDWFRDFDFMLNLFSLPSP